MPVGRRSGAAGLCNRQCGDGFVFHSCATFWRKNKLGIKDAIDIFGGWTE